MISYNSLSAIDQEAVRCGRMTCDSWNEWISYYRWLRPEIPFKKAQKKAANLWVLVQERGQ